MVYSRQVIAILSATPRLTLEYAKSMGMAGVIDG